MFDKFGEFDSFSEINELAENLLNEGDIESLKVVAKENGIQADFVDLYANGEIPELCDKLTAALGKIDVEAAELKPKEIILLTFTLIGTTEFVIGLLLIREYDKLQEDRDKRTKHNEQK